MTITHQPAASRRHPAPTRERARYVAEGGRVAAIVSESGATYRRLIDLQDIAYHLSAGGIIALESPSDTEGFVTSIRS